MIINKEKCQNISKLGNLFQKHVAGEQAQTTKSEFSSVPDCMIISDEEDDKDLFSNSQLYKISEKIKSEQVTFDDTADPYYNIKQELRDLDCCDNNQFVVDLTEDENYFEKTSDLLRILVSKYISNITE